MPPSEPRHRVLLAIGVYQAEHGGASEWLRNYAQWLATRGHQVSVACERSDAAPPESCNLLTLPVSRHTKNSWSRAVALRALVKEHAAEVVHDTGCLLASDIFHPLMGSLIHNWHRQLRAFPLKLRFRWCRRVQMWGDARLQWHQRRRHRILVACSKRAAADFAQVGCRHSVVIPNGIRVPDAPTADAVQRLRQELGAGDRVLVLATATNFYLKGVMTLLRAIPLLDGEARKNLLVVITGHNHDDAFQMEINQRNLGECCRLEGWVKDIDAYYAAADIFLHPTFHDAGSLSTLKALATGCAVVTSRFDGSADLIQNGVNGLVLDRPQDPRELAGILSGLLNPDRRKQLGAAAMRLAPFISQEHQFQRLEALYSGIVSEKIRAA